MGSRRQLGTSARQARLSARLFVALMLAAVAVSPCGADPLPPPWQQTDVGDVGAAGSASYSTGSFTVSGSGADIWNQADEFHFVYQPASGDFEISAQVTAVGDTGAWAMAGVMIRDGLGAGARHGIVSMTRAQGWSFTWREQGGGTSSFTDGGAGTAPAWVKLRRVGSVLTAFRSVDGASWTPFGAATIALPSNLQVGLAVSAVNDGALCTSTFDSVAIGPPSGGGVADVTVDPSITHQTMDGIGVNANHRSWRGGELAPALDRLIDEAGMSLFRLIFDNSDWEDPNDNADAAVMDQTYYDSVYGSARFAPLWETAAYLNGRGIVDGLVFNFMGPGPGWLGGQYLDAGKEAEWAEMITSVLLYARNVRGIQFHLVAPTNEPNISQEGIHMEAAQYVTALHALALRLDAEGLGDVRFVAPDLAGGGTSYMPELLADPVVMAKLVRFGAHSYSGGGSADIADFIASSSYPDRSHWMTEFNVWCPTCDGGVPGTYDWSYTRGTAEYLFDHLESGATGAFVWEGYDSSYAHHSAPWSFWGVLRVDNVNASALTYSPRKNFYTVAQMSRFVAPGDVRIDAATTASGLRLLAFKRPSTGGVAIVGFNDEDNARTLTFDVSALPSVTQLQLVQTTSSLNFDYGPALPLNGGQVTVQVAADSVFTLTSTPIGSTSVCPAAPSTCRSPTAAQASLLTMRKGATPDRDRLRWKWGKGQQVMRDELGDPTVGDAYDLCIYDGNSLLLGLVAPAGEICGGSVSHPAPCWKANAKGYLYSDRGLTPSGIRTTRLVSGDETRASAVVTGKGVNLTLPDPSTILGPLQVQLRRHDGQLCLGATFSSPFQKQDMTRLRARSD